MREEVDIQVCRAAIAALEAHRAAARPPGGPAAAPGLQHRLVTVLFADVVGSTAMAQRLGAEDTLAVQNSALRGMDDIVQLHQGRVLRFTGDGTGAEVLPPPSKRPT